MTASARPKVSRAHWINAIVGFYDSVFGLNDEERLLASSVVGDLLTFLNIPERGEPVEVPGLLNHEIRAQFYERQLFVHDHAARPVRGVGPGDFPVQPEAWRNCVLKALLSAYPDLEPLELMGIARALDHLLTGLGLPHRAAYFIPEDLVRAAKDS